MYVSSYLVLFTLEARVGVDHAANRPDIYDLMVKLEHFFMPPVRRLILMPIRLVIFLTHCFSYDIYVRFVRSQSLIIITSAGYRLKAM